MIYLPLIKLCSNILSGKIHEQPICKIMEQPPDQVIYKAVGKSG